MITMRSVATKQDKPRWSGKGLSAFFEYSQKDESQEQGAFSAQPSPPIFSPEFLQSETCRDLQKSLKEFSLKDCKQYEVKYFDFEETKGDIRYTLRSMQESGSDKGYIPSEFTESGCKRAAGKEVERRIASRKAYLSPDNDNNLAQELGQTYAKLIIREIDACKEKIVVWHKENAFDLPAVNLRLNSIDGGYVTISFLSNQKTDNNIAKLIQSYINGIILSREDYGKDFSADDLDVTYSDAINHHNIGISPAEEWFKKFTGDYYVWSYRIDDKSMESLNERVSIAATGCAKMFLGSGYLQDISDSLIRDFIAKLKN